jgi:hypothetical protein
VLPEQPVLLVNKVKLVLPVPLGQLVIQEIPEQLVIPDLLVPKAQQDLKVNRVRQVILAQPEKKEILAIQVLPDHREI